MKLNSMNSWLNLGFQYLLNASFRGICLDTINRQNCIRSPTSLTDSKNQISALCIGKSAHVFSEFLASIFIAELEKCLEFKGLGLRPLFFTNLCKKYLSDLGQC